jgi:hypothetical protein
MAGLNQMMEPSYRLRLVPDSSDLTQEVSNLRGLCLECSGKARWRVSGLEEPVVWENHPSVFGGGSYGLSS